MKKVTALPDQLWGDALFQNARDQVLEKGMTLNLSEAFVQEDLDGSVRTFLVPIAAGSHTAPLTSIQVALSGRRGPTGAPYAPERIGTSKLSMAQYNDRYSAEKAGASTRWLIYSRDGKFAPVFYLEVTSFGEDQMPVVAISNTTGAGLVFNLEENVLYTVEPGANAKSPVIDAASTRGATLYDCILKEFQLTGWDSFAGVVDNFCKMPDTLKTLMSVTTSLMSCLPAPFPHATSCPVAVLQIIYYLTCPAASIATCMAAP